MFHHIRTNVDGNYEIFLSLKLLEMTRKEKAHAKEKRHHELYFHVRGDISEKYFLSYTPKMANKLQLLNALQR